MKSQMPPHCYTTPIVTADSKCAGLNPPEIKAATATATPGNDPTGS